MALLSYFVRSGQPENPKNMSRIRYIMHFIHNQEQDTKNDTIRLIPGRYCDVGMGCRNRIKFLSSV